MKNNKTLYIATISNSAIRDAQIYHGEDSSLPWDDDDGWKDATINHFVGVYKLDNPSLAAEEGLRKEIAEQEDVLPDLVCLAPLNTCLRKAKTSAKIEHWTKPVMMRNITSNEYDLLCEATNESDDLTHWSGIWSWTDTVYNEIAFNRMIRGYYSARGSGFSDVAYRGSFYGWRPAFESLNPDTDCPDLSVGDVVVMGTIYVGSEPLKVPTNPAWNGDITAYDENGSGVTSKIALGAALEDAAYQVKAVYVGNGVFVCDRVVLNWISWNKIHAALSASEKRKNWSELVKMRNITSEEYDMLCDATNKDDSLMHWANMYSRTDTIYNNNLSYRVIRGGGSSRASSYGRVASRSGCDGWRPAFESLNPSTDCANLSLGDVVVMGTLYVGDNAIKVPTNPIWNGDITAYDEDGSGATSKITLGAALEDAAYQVKAVYVGNGLFVCDRAMLVYISWNQINAALS